MATPTRAVAAASRRSATRTSARWRRQVGGIAERQRLGIRRGIARFQQRVQCIRALAQQHRQAMLTLHFGHFQQRNVGLDRLQPRAAALHVQPAAAPSSHRASVRRLGVAQVSAACAWLPRALLGAAQLEVVARHFARPPSPGRSARLSCSAPRPARASFGGTALAAEQVQLPAGIEAELVGLAEDALTTGGKYPAPCGGHSCRRWSRAATGPDAARRTPHSASRTRAIASAGPGSPAQCIDAVSCSSTGSSNCAHQLATGEVVLNTGAAAPWQDLTGCAGGAW